MITDPDEMRERRGRKKRRSEIPYQTEAVNKSGTRKSLNCAFRVRKMTFARAKNEGKQSLGAS